MTSHASNLVLDELAAGLPTLPEAEEHLRTCEHCRRRLSALRADRDQLSATPEYSSVLRSLRPPGRPKPWWQRWQWYLPLASVTAATAVVALPARHHEPRDRIKGNTSLVLVKEPTGEAALGALRPGERVSLAVGSAGSRYVLVVAVAEDGAVTQVWPTDSRESGPAPEGAAAKLSPSFFVTPGSVQLFSFFSDSPLRANVVTEALQRAVIEARNQGLPSIQVSPTLIPGETGHATALLCVEGSSCLSPR